MRDDSPVNAFTAAIEKLLSLFGAVGRRILIHICSVIAAVFLCQGTLPLSEYSVAVWIYLGLICLFPRGNPADSSWYLPLICGIVQCLVLLLTGMFWPLIFFWGGAQTWVQRLIRSKGHLGWEWLAAPFLVLGAFGFFQELHEIGMPFTKLLISFPIVAIFGWLIQGAWMRFKMRPLQTMLMTKTAQGLHDLATDSTFSPDLRQQIDLLQVQSLTWIKKIPSLNDRQVGIVKRIDSIRTDLEEMANKAHETGWPPDTSDIAKTIGDLNAQLMQQIGEFTASDVANNIEPPADATLEERMAFYESSARGLLIKQKKLPQTLWQPLEGIAVSTANIVRCMRTDPQDRDPGNKFLSRYLKATHQVIDEYIRLASENVVQEDVKAALARSGEILGRLAKAFKEEHASLLQNDADNYTAELNTLDKLLKMRGH